MTTDPADLLARTTEAPLSDIQRDLDALGRARVSTETSARALRNAGSETGFEGASGEAASDACLNVANKLVACVDKIQAVAVAGNAARGALEIAREDYAALPSTEMPHTLSQYLYNVRSTAPDASVSLEGIGTVPAAQAESLWLAERKRQRDAAAAAALARLQATMDTAAADLSDPRVIVDMEVGTLRVGASPRA